MTDTVKNRLESLLIKLVPVPANMTHFFQPLDLTVNRVAKNLSKNSSHHTILVSFSKGLWKEKIWKIIVKTIMDGKNSNLNY